MKKYLVTGGAGFIGSHIVRSLLEQGNFVRVLDNFSTGKKENLAGLEVEIMEGDLGDESRVRQAVAGMEIVFHEAAFVSVPSSMLTPLNCFHINQQGTAILLEAARQAEVERVVMASSAAVYGDSEALPLAETTTLYPLSPYAVSKRVGELYSGLYTNSFGLDVVALRYFNVYGPRQRPDSMYAAAVPIFMRRLIDRKPITIYGDGGQTRDLVYVGDIVRANLIASEHPAAPGEVFNVCTGKELRILDLLQVLMELFPDASAPEFSEVRTGDIYRSVGDPTKAEALLGFSPQTALFDGLKAVKEWMESA